jgi:hypothetical protein
MKKSAFRRRTSSIAGRHCLNAVRRSCRWSPEVFPNIDSWKLLPANPVPERSASKAYALFEVTLGLILGCSF